MLQYDAANGSGRASTLLYISAGTGIHIDWGSSIEGFGFSGQALRVIGNAGNDSVYVGSGTVINAEELGDKNNEVDKLFFEGQFSDYQFTNNLNIYTVSGLLSAGREEVVSFKVGFSGQDLLYFSDVVLGVGFQGLWDSSSASFRTIDETLKPSLAITDYPAPVRLGESLDLAHSSDLSRFYVSDGLGVNIGPMRTGSSLSVVGNIGDDQVYVGIGTTVDATDLRAGDDRVYLQGLFSDYGISVDSQGIYTVLGLGNQEANAYDSNSIYSEKVLIKAVYETNSTDRLVFADGYVDTGFLDLWGGAGFNNISALTDNTEKTPFAGPKVTITSTNGDVILKPGATSQITFVLEAAPDLGTSFTLDDVAVEPLNGGSISNLVSLDATTYTADFVASIAGDVKIIVESGAFKSSDDKTSVSAQLALVIDAISPQIQSASAVANTNILTLHSSEPLEITGSYSDFSVYIDQVLVNVTGIDVAGADDNTLNLTLDTVIANDASISVDFSNSSSAVLDRAENDLVDFSGLEVTVANVPTVEAVYGVGSKKVFNSGDVVQIEVAFSAPVVVSGTPELDVGSANNAIYRSGSTSNKLLFELSVTDADISANVDYLGNSALQLDSGSISDASGNNVFLELPTPSSPFSLSESNLQIDNDLPTFVSSEGFDGASRIRLAFNEPLTGTPESSDFSVTVDGASVDVSEVLVSGRYVSVRLVEAVQENNPVSVEYVASGDQLTSIYDLAGNELLSFTSSLTVSPARGAAEVMSVSLLDSTRTALRLGEELFLTVQFDDLVYVSNGTPTLSLVFGNNVNRTASYFSGSGSDTLVFRYLVQDGDSVETLTHGNKIALAGATLNSLSGSGVVLDLPAPGTQGSLSDTVNVLIDGVLPEFSVLAADAGSLIVRLAMDASDPLTVDGVLDALHFAVDQGGVDNPVVGAVLTTGTDESSQSISVVELTLTNPIANNVTLTVDYTQPSDPTDSTPSNQLLDANGNALASFSGSGVAVITENDAPEILSVQANPGMGLDANKVFKSGDFIDIDVTFDEVVYVTGSPILQLQVGRLAEAQFISNGSSTSTLTFRYQVVDGDSKEILTYASNSALRLNGGSVSDGAGNTANILLPNPGESGSLSASSSINVDGSKPKGGFAGDIQDVDGNGVISAGDVLNALFFEAIESTNQAEIEAYLENLPILGDGADIQWSSNKAFTITLGSSPSVEHGTEIAMPDVIDLAGNVNESLVFIV